MSRYVLDSFAILAFLQKEVGWERVKSLLRDASRRSVELHMSAINLAEVQYRIIRTGQSIDEQLAALGALPIQIASADAYVAQMVQLKARYPLSLADCFAAALAQDLACPIVTGDPEFRKLEGVVQIEWLG